ncbi:MAG: DUF3800 domain-containing protein [Thermoplasmata archaeon]|nr:DUF3800 domain-containing protein [Thermoplasmata archaeon]
MGKHVAKRAHSADAPRTHRTRYVFIDESGDLGQYGSRFFTMAAVVVTEPKFTSRIIKKLRQRKLKKNIRQLPEIKANNSNRMIREYVLKKVQELDCEIFSIVVEKESIQEHLFEVKNQLYSEICGERLEKIDMDSGTLRIVIDKKDTNTLLRKGFDQYLHKRMDGSGAKITIEHKPSHLSNELQVVDFIAWAIQRKFNTGDCSYYPIIEEKIINREDMLL